MYEKPIFCDPRSMSLFEFSGLSSVHGSAQKMLKICVRKISLVRVYFVGMFVVDGNCGPKFIKDVAGVHPFSFLQLKKEARQTNTHIFSLSFDLHAD